MKKITSQPEEDEEISRDLLEFLYVLSEGAEFQKDLDMIMEKIHEVNFDLSKIQGEVVALIKNSLGKMSFKDEVKELLKAFEENEGALESAIGEMAIEIMMDRSMGVYAGAKNLKEFLESEASKLLRKTMRRFIVYEIYKMLSPRRIAGKTKLENFIANFILRGEKAARRFEGGSDEDIRRYGAVLLKKLRMLRSRYLKSGGKGISIKIGK